MMRSRRLGTLARVRLAIVVVVLITVGWTSVAPLPHSASAQNDTPEIELVRKYAPIVYVKEQPSECSSTGEPYLPVSVDAIFDDPDVTVRRIKTGDEPEDPVVQTAPNAQSLAGLDENHYLDLPGNPRNPQCDYEEWFRLRSAEKGIEPLLYARIATEEGRPGELALQYWHYWVFDDFNNTHESDWEMVQLNFAADNAAEALTMDPSLVAFAQHGGGESAEWDDEKLQREGDRILIFPAAGSHATYYQEALWIGWGANGSGFGCDDIREPIVRLSPDIALIPDEITPDGDFAWLLFEGRWGERQNWEFNGPKGPNQGAKWTTPISWTDDIRTDSLAVPSHSTVGPGPSGIFCSISGTAGSLMTFFPVFPELVALVPILILILLAAFLALGWRYITKGTALYFRYLPPFLVSSMLLFFISSVGASLDDAFQGWVPDRNPGGVTGFGALFESGLGIGLQGIQQLLVYALVAPAIIYLTRDILRDDDIGVRESWRFALGRFPRTLLAVILPLLLTGIMMATVILAPLAIYKGVQWLFTPHAVIISDADWRQARHVSKRIVRKHWIRSLGIAAAITIFSGVPGPLVGTAALALFNVSMDVADLISTAIYLIAYPIAISASTLYYLTLGGRATADEILAAPKDEELSQWADAEEEPESPGAASPALA